MMRPHLHRRRLLQAMLATLAGGALPAGAQQRVPIADMHSHYGMFSRFMSNSGLAAEMRKEGVAFIAWKLVPDARWTRRSAEGIYQSGTPGEGQLAARYTALLGEMKAYVADQKLRTVLTAADVDACLAGEAGIVLAAEGADFLEGRVENLQPAYAAGLRHLQLVHYIHTPVGDFQTAAPTHNGLSAMGLQLIEACNARGVLVDLSHSSGTAADQALDAARAPLVWSHGWVDSAQGTWQDRFGFLKRRLSLAHAKRIAAGGGVVGLWGLGLARPGLGWSVGRGDTRAYAQELANLVGRIGADHVALGTDIEGLGTDWSVNTYAHVREVIGHLESMNLGGATVEKIACGNYSRVLKTVLRS